MFLFSFVLCGDFNFVSSYSIIETNYNMIFGTIGLLIMSGGAFLCEGFHEEELEGGVFYWGTRKMMFLRDMQNAL